MLMVIYIVGYRQVESLSNLYTTQGLCHSTRFATFRSYPRHAARKENLKTPF